MIVQETVSDVQVCVCCSVLQRAAVRCSVLQCVAVCSCVLLRVPVVVEGNAIGTEIQTDCSTYQFDMSQL